MESYLRVVGQAVLVFPVAAALIALPFLIPHYRKYGGMTFARFFLSYSFVHYALCGKGISSTKVRTMYKKLFPSALKNTLSPKSRSKFASPTHSVTPGFTS